MSPYQLTLLFATEVTERTEFFGLPLRAVARQSPELRVLEKIPSLGPLMVHPCTTTAALPLAMTEKACRQNLFLSVCSVTSVAKSCLFMPHSLVMAARLNLSEYM